MKRVHRLYREEKSKLFSQKQTEQLSGFSREQMRKLDEKQIVVSQKHPVILYSWKQVIFLKTLFHFREDLTWGQIEESLNNCEYNVQEIVDGIQETVIVAIGEVENKKLVFINKVESKMNDFDKHRGKKLMNIDSEMISEAFKVINAQDENHIRFAPVKNKFNAVIITIPQIIIELKKTAEELEIENFELKVG
ncbi:MAG: hypothetical protein KME31_31910 [Tolypothrix carrinoi HA7290-LM1]|jgi:hypothetical protein|nr:hypothetical protein [Tolypothrix carrinoi HA7290-LM1]